LFALRSVGQNPKRATAQREPLPNAGEVILRWGTRCLVLATLLRPIIIEGVLAEVLTILLGGSILVLVGFIDDQFSLPAWVRLLADSYSTL